MVATSPVRHESPASLQPTAVEVHHYQAPWKALTEFALQNEIPVDQAPFQQLVSTFGGSGGGGHGELTDDDDDDTVVSLEERTRNGNRHSIKTRHSQQQQQQKQLPQPAPLPPPIYPPHLVRPPPSSLPQSHVHFTAATKN